MSQTDAPRELLRNLDEDLVLGERLGEGGGGSVHTAEQRSLRRTVAVKRLHSLSRGDAERRFREEATIMGRVAHPNIVPVLMHGRLGGRPVLVMEHVDGLDLAALLRKISEAPRPLTALTLRTILGGAALPWPDRTPWWRVGATLVASVARALDHAHRSGVLHRDIKPANVLLAGNGTALLTDFGVAQWIEDESDSSSGRHRALSTSGTLAYAAPESLDGVPHTTSSDIYSLGILARELITGQAAYLYPGDGPAARIRAISEGRFSPLGRDLPSSLRATLDVACAPNPDKRYASADDFARDLENAMAGRPVLARPEGRLQRSRRWVQQRSQSGAAVGVLAVLVFGAPAALQTVRLRAATRVAGAAEAASGHLRVALDGIGVVLQDVETKSLSEQPLLNAKRAQLLEAGASLGLGLEATITEEERAASSRSDGDSLLRRIHRMREQALRGLVNTALHTGAWTEARQHLEQLIEAESDGVALGDPFRTLETQFLQAKLAHAEGDFEATKSLAELTLAHVESLDEASTPNLSTDLSTDLRLSLNLRNMLVEVALAHDEVPRAVELGKAATRDAEAWVRVTQGSELARRELVRTLGNYVAALIEADEPDQAKTLLGRAFELYSTLPATPAIQTSEALQWNNLGAIELKLGRYAESEEAETRALSLHRALLAADPTSAHLLFSTARSHLRLGEAQLRNSGSQPGAKTSTAINHLAMALGGCRKLAESPDVPWHHLNLQMQVARAMGDYYFGARKNAAALVTFNEAIQSAHAADTHSPERRTPEADRKEMWVKRTAVALMARDSDPITALDAYYVSFPGDAQVASYVATMACTAAARLERLETPLTAKGQVTIKRLEETALDKLEKAAELGDLPLIALRTNSAWKRLRQSPRYRALMERAQ